MCEWQLSLLILGCLILKWKEAKGGEVCVEKNVWKIGRVCGSSCSWRGVIPEYPRCLGTRSNLNKHLYELGDLDGCIDFLTSRLICEVISGTWGCWICLVTQHCLGSFVNMKWMLYRFWICVCYVDLLQCVSVAPCHRFFPPWVYEWFMLTDDVLF